MLFLVHLIWSVLTIALGIAFLKQVRKHGGAPALDEVSSRGRFANNYFGRFMRKMGFTVVGLCFLSAWIGWYSMFWGVLLILAIPAIVAIQITRGKSAIEGSYKRSLPDR